MARIRLLHCLGIDLGHFDQARHASNQSNAKLLDSWNVPTHIESPLRGTQDRATPKQFSWAGTRGSQVFQHADQQVANSPRGAAV
jgi:hypothetical protein